MSKFKKKVGKGTPAISTASLPDIVFMLLFFFMVVTVMRDSEVKIKYEAPLETELTKLEKKSLVNYIYIGKPLKKYQADAGTVSRMQLGEKFAKMGDIPLFLEKHRLTVPESQRGGIKSSIRADKHTTMGIIGDVKTTLRKSRQLLVNYSAKPRPKN